MINVKRQTLLVLFLFCILFIIALAPVLLLSYNNARLLDTPHTAALSSDAIMDEPVVSQDCDVWERLLIVKKSTLTKNDVDVIVTWQESAMPEDEQAKLVEAVEQQLLILQELKALPQVALGGHYRPTVFKKTYMNMQNPTLPIHVWRVQIYYLDFFVDVYMDGDTSVLYDVSILSQTDQLIYEKNKISANGFFNYVQSFSDGREKDGERFDANGIYEDHAIRLFATSFNEHTQAFTSYNFEDSQNYAVVNSTSEYADIKTEAIP